ncbi:MAG: sulfite exporter TauE/SafE family protein [Curvibacter sp.]|nr:MAG: sulfite exporter TauE/SafE family protein [Curvibacter sp.]
MHDVAFVGAGFFVGLVAGLTGVGGGSLMMHILVFFFGAKRHLAVGNDLSFRANRGRTAPFSIAAGHEITASSPRPLRLPLLLGAPSGALVTLTSVGAGAIGVTVLMVLYPLLPLPRIVAADIAYAVPLTLVAGMGHASLGSVDWALLAKLLAGSIPGIWVGSHLMFKTPERVIRSLLSLLLAYAGLKLIAL